MDRELLLEIGCEELPASWLPALTNDIGEVFVAQLTAARLPPEAPAETFSTPRRLTVRVARVPERQTDLEELVNGPPVAAAFKPDGTPTPAAAGFAAKQGVEVASLERLRTAGAIPPAASAAKRPCGRSHVLGATLGACPFKLIGMRCHDGQRCSARRVHLRRPLFRLIGSPRCARRRSGRDRAVTYGHHF